MAHRSKLDITLWVLTAVLVLFVGTTSEALAQNKIFLDVDETVSFRLPEADSAITYQLRLPGLGLLEVAGLDNAKGRIEAVITDQAGNVLGNGGVRVDRWQNVSVLVRRSPDATSDNDDRIWSGELRATFRFWQPDTDVFEPNDTEAAAFELRLSDETPIAGGPISFFPKGDRDYFKLIVSSEGYVTPHLSSVPNEYEDATVSLRDGANRTWQWGEPRLLAKGSYNVEIVADRTAAFPAELRFDYARNWDVCEPNNIAEEACPLDDAGMKKIALLAETDTDWFSYETQMPGVIVLTLSGLPQTRRNAEDVVTAGLDFSVETKRVRDGPDEKRPTVSVSDGVVYIIAPSPGVYRFALSGAWRGYDPRRAISIRARFVDLSATARDDARFVLVGVFGDGHMLGSAELELSVLAALSAGAYSGTFSAEDIEKQTRRFMNLGDRPDPTVEPKPAPEHQPADPIRPVATPVLTEEEKELARLQALQAYLDGSGDAHLWRHHYRRKNGEIWKRLEQVEQPELAGPELELVKTVALSPIMSARLLIRAVQDLE